MDKLEIIEYLTDVQRLENDIYTLNESVNRLQKQLPKRPEIQMEKPKRAEVAKPVARKRSGENGKSKGGWIGFILGCLLCITGAHSCIEWVAAPLLLMGIFAVIGGVGGYAFDNPDKSNREAEEEYRRKIQQAESDYQRAMVQWNAEYSRRLDQARAAWNVQAAPILRR